MKTIILLDNNGKPIFIYDPKVDGVEVSKDGVITTSYLPSYSEDEED